MNYPLFSDEYFMQEALKEARSAFEEDEIPVGAVIVSGNTLIARTHNQTERLQDVTAHAEILAITAASQSLGAKYLTGCTMYVTLEPCVMCASAIKWAQISRIVFGAKDPGNGFTNIVQNIVNPGTKVSSGILHKDCAQLLKAFFSAKR